MTQQDNRKLTPTEVRANIARGVKPQPTNDADVLFLTFVIAVVWFILHGLGVTT
jgi:hypothetical protein